MVHRWYAGYETEHRNPVHQGDLVTENFILQAFRHAGTTGLAAALA
ncbi:hypothetical protein ACIRPT_27145 [Streptomyces sp. NPDC101227]